jgi:hypothetical protein
MARATVLLMTKSSTQGICSTGFARWLKRWAQHSATYRLFIESRLEQINYADVDLYIRITLAAIDVAKTK